jgi:hypothetical protein
LNDGRITNPNVVRVARSAATGTGYHRVEGNRRASRNGPVSDLPPEIPPLRFATFCTAVPPRCDPPPPPPATSRRCVASSRGTCPAVRRVGVRDLARRAWTRECRAPKGRPQTRCGEGSHFYDGGHAGGGGLCACQQESQAARQPPIPVRCGGAHQRLLPRRTRHAQVRISQRERLERWC